MGCISNVGFRRRSGGVALDRLGDLNGTFSSTVRTRTDRARGAQDWPAEAIGRIGTADGRGLSGVQIHDRTLLSGRSRARPDAAEPSIAVADRKCAVRLRGVPPRVAAATGSFGLD